MRYFVLITGASSGIGQSACIALLGKGYYVIAGVRNLKDADPVVALGGDHVLPLLMDVTDTAAITKARNTAEQWIGDGALVAIFNNAGVVVHGSVLHIPVDAWRQQFEVNVLGVITVTQLFFPLLAKPRQAGDTHPRRILQMGSVSGLFTSPFLGPYAASKYALEALSDALRRELYMHDIQVVIIEAGNITTPIWEKARQGPSYFGAEYESILQHKDRMLDGLIADGIPVRFVDDIVLKAVMQSKIKPRYLVKKKKWLFHLIRLLPAKWVDQMIASNLRKKSGIRPF